MEMKGGRWNGSKRKVGGFITFCIIYPPMVQILYFAKNGDKKNCST